MATTAAGAPASAKPSPGRWHGDDLPSWLSPMLVKELRQGLQSGAFSMTFTALQGGLALLMTVWIVTAAESGAGQFFRGLFWFLFTVSSTMILPLRGLLAIRSEEVGQTFDLLRLTRLGSTQIVVGKWIAIMAQVVLVAIAVLPYVVLQYFLGGYGVIGDMTAIGCLVVVAGLVTAAALMASTQPPAIRGLVISLGSIVLSWGVPVIGMSGGFLPSMTPGGLGLLALATAPLTVVLLEYAIAAIAPRAENHAVRKRLLALGLVGIAFLAWWGIVLLGGSAIALSTWNELVWPAFSAWVIVALVGVGETLGDPVPLRAIHEPFARFPALAMLLTPGWATGTLFLLLLGALFLVFAQAFAAQLGGDARITIPAYSPIVLAAVLFPIPFTRLFATPRLRAVIYGLVSLMTILPVLYLWQTNRFRPSLTLQVLEFVALLFPWPSLMMIGDPRVNPGLGYVEGLFPIITTLLVWLPLLPAWRAELLRAWQRAAACRTARGSAAPRTAP
ncbi:MAG: hypothetical protein FJ309_15145 [Planctomycetes bacterium]|nr:hypothetical protein [Planctomycetota bacterium]